MIEGFKCYYMSGSATKLLKVSLKIYYYYNF